MERPRIRSQYRVDVLGNIRERLTSLSGFAAFCFEMMQNAEDAGSEWMEIKFADDSLKVSNASTFDQDDWDRITEIAQGNKPKERIGTFGVGFTSVYQYTDEPTVCSSGWRVTFSLPRIAANEVETILSVPDEGSSGTTFEIPWAFNDSAVRSRLEQPVVSKQGIRSFFEQSLEAVPLGLVFLASLRRVVIQFGERRVTLGVEDTTLEGDVVLRRIRVTDSASAEPHEARWLLHRVHPEEGDYPETGKRPEVCLAFPIGATRAVEGRLYSFLPTQHRTGLPFHIHGSFFAKSDRKGIERDGESDHVRWNSQLLSEVPGLLADSLEHLLRHCDHQATLAALPPSTYKSDNFDEFNGLVQAVVEAVKDGLPLLLDRQAQPAPPEALFLPQGLDESQRELAERCGARFVHEDFAGYVAWLRKFGLAELAHSDLASLPLMQSLSSTECLDEAPEPFTSAPFRAALYALVGHLLDEDKDHTSGQRSLSQLHLAVGHRGTIGPLDTLCQVSEQELQVFADTFEADAFWQLDDQGSLPASLSQRLTRFDLDDAIAHLQSSTIRDKHFCGDDARLALLYLCIADWVQRDASKDQRAKLRNLPIWRRADGQHVELKRLSLPSSFHDPLDLGVVFEHPLGDSAEALKRTHQCLRELGAEPLNFRTYCLKHLPEYVAHHDQSSDPRIEERYTEVLDVLRSRLREYQDDAEVVGALKTLAIVPSNDRALRAASSLYWRSDVLDAVFGRGKYPTAAHAMGAATPSWQEFYEALGSSTVPRIQDIVDRIIELSKSAQSSDRDDALRHLFTHLNERADDWSEAEAKLVRCLQAIDCMPATPDGGGLAAPAVLYISDLKNLVGSQARCVSFYFRPRTALRDALALKDTVRVSTVVANLRDRVAKQQEIPKPIYEFLNAHADDAAVRHLRDEPCVDIGNGRILKGAQIFFEPVQFGKYRFHLPEQLAPYTDFFRTIGVRHVAEIDPEALVEVLSDISSEWSVGNRMPDEEALAVIEKVLAEMSRLNAEGEHNGLSAAIAPILGTKCLPRADGLFVTPTQLVIKDQQAFAQEFGERLGASLIDKRPATWQVLHSFFAVPMLSAVVTESLREPDRCVLNRQATTVIRGKRQFVARIVESLRGSFPRGWRLERLDELDVHTADPLQVEYQLTACAPIKVGPRPVKAVYDEGANRLLIAPGEALHSAAFARAYAQALNPEIELSRTVPLLRTVFEIDDPAALSAELSEMGVDLLSEDRKVLEGLESEAIQSLGAEDEEDNGDDAGAVADTDGDGVVDRGADSGGPGNGVDRAASDAIDGEPREVRPRKPTDPSTGGGTKPSPTRSGSDGLVESEGSATTGESDAPAETEATGVIDEVEDAEGRDDDSWEHDGAEADGDADRGYGGRPRAGSGGAKTGSRGGARRRRSGARSGDRDPEHNASQRSSPYESSQNWFRVRIARNRDCESSEERDRLRSEASDDTEARAAVIAFEKSRGWDAVPAPTMQKGFDVVSTDPTTGEKRRIEVKGLSSSWDDDATVRLSYSQFHDAHAFEGHKEDYWLYVVDRLLSDRPRIFPIQNPARSTYWFYLQAQDWGPNASDAKPDYESDRASPGEAQGHGPTDVQLLRDCVPEALHPVLDALGDLPLPVAQFELEAGGGLVLVHLAWPVSKFGIIADGPDGRLDLPAPGGWTLLAASSIAEGTDWALLLSRHLSGGGA